MLNKNPQFAFEVVAILDATKLLDHWQIAKNAVGTDKSVNEGSTLASGLALHSLKNS